MCDKKTRILIVDDEPNNLRLMMQVLDDTYQLSFAGNGIKFTEKGSVSIRVKYFPPSGFKFEIQDTGIGIPKQRADNIFEAFTQADGSTARRFGGIGLGTTISRQIVELMGGKIWVKSREGEGTTFYFEVSMEKM